MDATYAHCPTAALCSCPVLPSSLCLLHFSPLGIAKGIRRIVAFTGEDAAKAIAEGNRLAAQIEAAKALPDSDLDKVLSAIKQVRKSRMKNALGKNDGHMLVSRVGFRVP